MSMELLDKYVLSQLMMIISSFGLGTFALCVQNAAKMNVRLKYFFALMACTFILVISLVFTLVYAKKACGELMRDEKTQNNSSDPRPHPSGGNGA